MLNILNKKRVIEDPPFARKLFGDTRFAVLWLVVRVWLGWQWIDAVSHKLSNPAWTQSGDALKGFWQSAVAIPETGRAAISFDWYRNFIQALLDAQAYTWFSKLIIAGELLIGIALIVGAFVGIAALFGALMNFNFMLAGSASTNPVLFLAAVSLILAWKIAGYIGADRVLLTWLGTPWSTREAQPERASSGGGVGIPEPMPGHGD